MTWDSEHQQEAFEEVMRRAEQILVSLHENAVGTLPVTLEDKCAVDLLGPQKFLTSAHNLGKPVQFVVGTAGRRVKFCVSAYALPAVPEPRLARLEQVNTDLLAQAEQLRASAVAKEEEPAVVGPWSDSYASTLSRLGFLLMEFVWYPALCVAIPVVLYLVAHHDPAGAWWLEVASLVLIGVSLGLRLLLSAVPRTLKRWEASQAREAQLLENQRAAQEALVVDAWTQAAGRP